jgi:hypothetical protein
MGVLHLNIAGVPGKLFFIIPGKRCQLPGEKKQQFLKNKEILE